ncbi:hypothetical protein XELAEV_18032876mg [Xenopus laevis]|uniref:Uncharacterized protein n=1 Tax=Xenopus laevis TaxID=8355 RepID=A0A974CJQ7_XENLA|nr:hypothetical protein XELAEV_18032876mg [Xenopus laevis]
MWRPETNCRATTPPHSKFQNVGSFFFLFLLLKNQISEQDVCSNGESNTYVPVSSYLFYSPRQVKMST